MDGHRDPMALWVGEWTPEDAIDAEPRRPRESRAPREEGRDKAERDTK